MNVLRCVLACAGVLPLALLVGCGGLERQLSRAFIHPEREITATPSDYGLAHRDVTVKTGHGALSGWFVPSAQSRGETVVFFHGDGTSIGDYGTYVRFLHAAGFHVFLYDYPGFGTSEGVADVGPLFDTIDAVIEAVVAQPEVDPKRLVAYGISLGSIVALRAAARHPALRAVAVENPASPDANVAAYLRRQYGWFARGVITAVLDTFVLPWGIEPADSLGAFDGPVLLAAADRDRRLDVDTAIALAQAYPRTVSLWMMRDTRHAPDSLEMHEAEYPAQIIGFFRDALAGTVRPVEAGWRAEHDAAGHRAIVRLGPTADGGRRPIQVWARDADGGFRYADAWQEPTPVEVPIDLAARPVAAGAHPPRRFVVDGATWRAAPSPFPAARVAHRALSRALSMLRTTDVAARRARASEAVDQLGRLGTLHPRLEAEMVPLFLELGRVFETADDLDRAAAWYRRCVRAAPRYPKAHFWIDDRVRIMRFQHGAAVTAARAALARLGRSAE